MLDTRRLRVLCEVARHGSFSAAADSLGYTQPAVSRQIATLEAELGTLLVRRVPQGAVLTDAGQLLVARAEEIIARLKDAEAVAEAAVIQAKGDVERDRLTADAEANRIRVTSSADSERMTLEARALKENPLLIQKIVAERLSDKLQIIMVPADGHNFFTNDVLRGLEAQVAAPDAGQRRAANQR